MNNDIYVVTSKCKKFEDWTSIGINSDCFEDIEKAIEFCRKRLNKEELEFHDKLLERKMINWYEFDSKDYFYSIKVLRLIK